MVSTMPGPSGSLLLGTLTPFVQDPLGFFQSTVDTYGDVSQFRLGPPLIGTNIILLNDPTMFAPVFGPLAKHFRKSIGYRRMKEALGNSLITAEGATWQGHHNAVRSYFLTDKVRSFQSTIASDTVGSMDAFFDQGRDFQVNLTQFLTFLTLRIASTVFFDVEIRREAELIDVLPKIQKDIVRRAMLPFDYESLLPTRGRRLHQANLSTLRSIVHEIIHDAPRLRGAPCLLDQMKNAVAAGKIPAGELHDLVTTILLAGHETTATSVAWCLYLLANSPATQDELYEEILLTEAAGQEGSTPQGHDEWAEARFPLLCSVIKETLRLYPAVWMIDREAMADVTVRDLKIARGSVVAISPYILHRDERCCARPDEFIPDRFNTNDELTPRTEWYLPFGLGHRRCIGDRFALIEMRIVLANLIRSFRFQRPEKEIQPDPDITLRMKGDFYCQLERRQQSVGVLN